MKYRSRNDIYASILKNTLNPILPTKIMYESYISYAQSKEYLYILQDAGLIKVNNPERDRSYLITDKGKKFLDIVDRMNEMIKGIRTI